MLDAVVPARRPDFCRPELHRLRRSQVLRRPEFVACLRPRHTANPKVRAASEPRLVAPDERGRFDGREHGIHERKQHHPGDVLVQRSGEMRLDNAADPINWGDQGNRMPWSWAEAGAKRALPRVVQSLRIAKEDGLLDSRSCGGGLSPKLIRPEDELGCAF